MSEPPRFLKIGRTDNVAVALADLAAGEAPSVDGAAVPLLEPVGRGHKFALRPIKAGESVIKYDMQSSCRLQSELREVLWICSASRHRIPLYPPL